MSGILAALTAGNLTDLRSDWAGEQYVTLCPNTNVISTDVTAVPAAKPYPSVTCTEGAWANVRVGMTVLFAHENDRRAAYLKTYVRLVPAGNTLYIGATDAAIAVSDFVWVIDDYALHAKAARDTGAAYTKDWDEAYHAPRPVVYNLKSAYAGFVDTATNVLTLALAPLAFATNPAASAVFTWLWDVGDGTITVGSANTQNITVTFPATAAQRWIHLIVTDDQGQAQTRHIFVAAHDAAHPPALGFRGASIDGTVEAGWSASFDAFDEVDTVLDGTLLVIWSAEYYGAVEVDNRAGLLETWAVDFVGRLRQETGAGSTDEQFAYLTSVGFEVEDAAAQLARLNSVPLALRNTASPTEWDELATLTPWRAVCHLLDTHSTALTLFSLQFDDVTDQFQQPYLGTEDGGMLGAVNALGERINAAAEFAPDGRFLISRSARFLSNAARNALTTVAGLTTEDVIDLAPERDHEKTVGVVEADGGMYTTASDEVTPLLAIAPGISQADAEGKSSLRSQVLPRNTTVAAAQTELNFRVGQALDAANPHDRLTVTLPPGYHVLIPSKAQRYTWTLDGSTNARGLVYTVADIWLLVSVRHTHDHATGTREVEAVFEAIGAAAASGQTVAYPEPGEIPSPYPTIPPFPAYPAFPELPEITLPVTPGVGDDLPYTAERPYLPPVNGSTVLIHDGSTLWLTHTFLTSSPSYQDITPVAGVTVKDAKFDFSGDGRGIYCLVYDSGADESTVYYAADGHANPPEWSAGAAVSGEWSVLRLTSTPGAAYILQDGSAAAWSYTFDFTLSNGGFAAYVGGVYSAGAIYSAGVGWINNAPLRACNIRRTFTPTTITRVAITYSATDSYALHPGRELGRNLDWAQNLNLAAGTRTEEDVRTTTSTSIEAAMVSTAGNVVISEIVVEGTGGNPFVAAGSVSTRYSADYGATFAAARVAGTAPGSAAGMDTIKVGSVVLAGINAQVRTAASGGVYSDEANGGLAGSGVTLLVIPYRRFGLATRNTNDATPEYLLGANSNGFGSETLWRVTDAGKTAITPTLSGTDAIAVGPDAAAMPYANSSKIALLATAAGAVHLLTSTNQGAAWSDRGAVGAGTAVVRMRKGDTKALQLFIADAVSGPRYSPNFGATIITKSYPGSAGVVGIEVYG